MLIVKTGTLHISDGTRRGLRLGPGQPVPEGRLDAAEIERLLADGILAYPAPAEVLPEAPLVSKGKWCKDPATLAGKTTAELRILTLEIDPEVEVAEMSHDDLLALLTADFALVFRTAQTEAATDKVRPPDAKVARARAKAQG